MHLKLATSCLAALLFATAARAELAGAHLRIDGDGQGALVWWAEVALTDNPADLGPSAAGFVSFTEVSRPFRAEVFGNFHTAGVVLDLPSGYRPRDIGEVQLFERRPAGERRLLNPVQVGTERYYASSVFGLEPDTPYTFRA